MDRIQQKLTLCIPIVKIARAGQVRLLPQSCGWETTMRRRRKTDEVAETLLVTTDDGKTFRCVIGAAGHRNRNCAGS